MEKGGESGKGVFIGQLSWPGDPGGEGWRKGIANASLCDLVETAECEVLDRGV